MGVKFNIGRPKITDDEIEKGKDFDLLVRRFREQSLKQARGDESWHSKKWVRYSTIIAGVTVICTITYQTLKNSEKQPVKKHETVATTSLNKKRVNPKVRRAAVSAPAEKLKTPYASYKVNAAKGGEFTHAGATKVRVPSGGFVDKNGRDVVGEVTIEYREFHDMGDIVMNGIPMAYDSTGHAMNLETAGMFDIRGHQEGEPVFVKAGTPIEVRLASRTSEDRFNQYYLDTVSRNWNYLRRDNPVASKSPSVKTKVAPPANAEQLATQLRKAERKTDSVAKIYKDKIARLPQAKKPFMLPAPTKGRPSFVLEGSYDEFPELAAFDNVLFEVGPENRNYTRELHDITWSDIKILPGPQKDRNYLLNLSYRNRHEQLVVYPTIAEKDMAAAQKTHDARLQEYNRLAEKRAAEERRLVAEMEAKQKAFAEEQRRLRQEADQLAAERARFEQSVASASFDKLSKASQAIRIFEVSRFGVYNSDHPHPRPQGEGVRPIFMLHGTAKFIRPDRVFLVDHSKKTVYEFAGNEQMTFDRSGNYSICAFTKKGLYVCDRASFASVADKESNHFEVKELPESAEHPAGLKKALEL
jgi:hypothetical protein